jgi:hypothetical protein
MRPLVRYGLRKFGKTEALVLLPELGPPESPDPGSWTPA